MQNQNYHPISLISASQVRVEPAPRSLPIYPGNCDESVGCMAITGTSNQGLQSMFSHHSNSTADRSSAKDLMAQKLRKMHKERVMGQLDLKLAAHSELFSLEPDYGSIFSKRFSNYIEDDE